jgi:hypothetical protein
MSDEREISFQTWICPQCHDDHDPGVPCLEHADRRIAGMACELEELRGLLAEADAAMRDALFNEAGWRVRLERWVDRYQFGD